MGDYGTGRYGGRVTLEGTGALRLDIRSLTQRSAYLLLT